MTKRLHPGTLLLVAAFATACGEVGYYDEEDDSTNDPANTGGWDGGQGGAAPDAGVWDAASSDSGSPPWDARFDAGNVGNAGDASTSWDAAPSNNWDASSAPDAASNGGWDASADAATADTGVGAPDSGSTNNACSTLSYTSFGQQFFGSYCVGCHGSVAPRGGIRLDSLSNVQARKAGVKNAVLSGAMPQGANRPSDADRQKLGQWIDCGAN